MPSRIFSTVDIEYSASIRTASDGDLWPTTWADDGHLYTANGDGTGFLAVPAPASTEGSTSAANPWADIVVNRIEGVPETGITGARLAAGAAVGPVWTDPAHYNRKPTGIVAVDGNGDGVDELYLAVQDLRYGDDGFDDVPAASISRSDDHGATWHPTATPMFTNYIFTTVFFLDYGQSNRHSIDPGYVYAYGLDNNWRDSFSDTVPDPVDLYLARVPVGAIQDRDAWQFFTGLADSQPQWSATDRTPVLTDTRRVYPVLNVEGVSNMSVMSQGGVVYNKPLDRYIYTSWTEYTYEFYEAPQPWGPWKLFAHKDFGPYPWWGPGNTTGPKQGGYATTIPSKFISDDGLTMWVQSNWFVSAATPEERTYHFSLRKMRVTPATTQPPANTPDPTRNLAAPDTGAVALDKTSHYGHLGHLNDGDASRSEDSWDGTPKTVDQWGYAWPRRFNLNRVVYTTGASYGDGGWFAADLKIQVRQDFAWVDVTNLTVDPPYPYDATATPYRTFTFDFDATWGDAVRIIGQPGGAASFTAIAELEVYYG